jgi:PDZ domain
LRTCSPVLSKSASALMPPAEHVEFDCCAVLVEEVTPGGNAEKAGVQPGDIIVEVSAYVLKQGMEGQYENEGYGQRPYTNWEKTMLRCEGVPFETCMNAIASNNERWGIRDCQLILLRPVNTGSSS